MADYQHVICVDGSDFEWIIKGFAMLVQDKYLKAIPYKDFTRLKKFNKEVELRFAPSDGAVMIVPTEPGLSLLWWGKKDDESLGSYLWEHFAEELKEMSKKSIQKSDTTKTYAYDIFGNDYSKAESDATALEAVSALAEKYNDYGSISAVKADTSATTAADLNSYYDYDGTVAKLATETISTWQDIETPIETLTHKVNEIKEEMLKDKEEICAHIENERYNLQNEIDTKPNFRDVENIVEDATYGLCGELDDVHYDLCALADKVATLEEKFKHKEEKEPLECETNKVVIYDVNGLPHEAEAKLQSTSFSYYPRKNYKIDFAGFGIDERKEKENNMDTAKMFNFDFGPVASHIRMSPYGLAMKNADGKYVSYDKTTGSVMDVEIFNFDAQKFLYKMPVAVNQVAVGDIVVHMRKPMFVRAVKDGVVSVIDIYNAEAKDILPVKSPFGFNFITKVVSLIDMTGADANSPFGNMLPLLMLGEGQDFKDILPLMLLTGNAGANAMSNSLMLYALMGDGNKDILPFLLMAGNNPFAPAAATNNCGCQNHNPEGQCHNG